MDLSITNKRLAIGIPLSWPFIPAPFFHTFVKMEKSEFIYITHSDGPIDEMRNRIVEKAMLSSCTHLLMLDTDMMYNSKTIPRLLSLVSEAKPVVGALCYRRYPPFDPILLKGEPGSYDMITGWKEGDLVEVDATGTGCLMFHMSIFRKMKPPWFRFRPSEGGGVIGEDVGFCWDLKRAGYRIFVDTSIPADHLSTMLVNKKTHALYRALKTIQAKREGDDSEEGLARIDERCVN